MDSAGGIYSIDLCGEAVTLTETSPSSSSGAGITITGADLVDILLWKRWYISLAVIVVATVEYIIFEASGLPFLSICSDVLLILIAALFLRANFAVLRNKPPQALPELVVSEEMVNNAAASIRVKINYTLLMAHDITFGKDFKLFFKAVVGLWLMSVAASYISFYTLAYIGAIISITVPALYSKFGGHTGESSGSTHPKTSKPYKFIDGNVTSRIPWISSKDKDT